MTKVNRSQMKLRKSGRKYYLEDEPVDKAILRFHTALKEAGTLIPTPSENIPLNLAHGRVTSSSVWAKISSPHYDAAAMDGIAVRSQETVGATETMPVQLKVGDQAVWLDTGDPIPIGFNAVIMVEVVHEIDDSTIEIMEPATPYQHIRPIGEDIVATELVLPQGQRLRPHDLAACAAAGISELSVRKYPKIAIIPTGSELVPVGTTPKPGSIIEFNSLMLSAMAESWGAQAKRYLPIPDDYERLKTTLLEAVSDSDIVAINAGSSAGSEDYTAKLVEDSGQLLVHGAALRPGHPVVLGIVNGKPVLGIPGYPVSASLTFEIFVKPLVERMLGVPTNISQQIEATLSRKIPSTLGDDEYIRVKLGKVSNKMIATPIRRGAGVIMSMVQADGLILIPRFVEGISAGEKITVNLLRSLEEIKRTIVIIGSHDVTLDLLASELRRMDQNISLASSNVGSLGGLLSLSRKECHLSGTHLLDEETGQYNLSFLKHHVKNEPMMLIGFVKRLQGLIVPRGNPKNISSLQDLIHNNLIFVNRQRGSGTRVLLDYKLRQHNLESDHISGYEHEEFTHLSVAAAVAGGRADVGLGILSAARAMNLDFIPLLTEQYDLAVPREHYESAVLTPIMTLIQSEDFKEKVESLGGYDTSMMGEILAECN